MHRNRNVDMKAIAWDAMKKYGFSPEFPPRVKDDVRAMSDSATRTTGLEIQDLRGLLWSSIDNFDSEDLDQLEFCERRENGEIGVKVAIADVDYYVGKDSPTDRHAAHNGTSVYTGVETFPMLPDKLSKGISSLLPGQDRLAVIIEYTVLPDGNVRHGGVYRALVKNKAKLIYEIIGKWQEGASPVPPSVTGVKGLEEQLRLQGEASRLLRQQRREQGALELNTIEPSPVIEDGKVKDLVVQEQNLARQLIEEFMVAANGTMVAVLGEAGLPMIQRIVRRPKYWEEIVLVAASYHEELPAEPDAKVLAQFLLREQKADPERFPDLSLTIVKLLGPGEYLTLEPGAPPTGHFSLAVIDYTHATAPNRRYVDVINQRLAKSVIGNTQSPYSAGELDELAAWLTDREKASKKVRRFMAKAVAAVLLQDRTGDIFDALVTGAKETGTFVRLIVPPAEGRVIRGEVGLKVGQKVRVRLLGADPYKGFIDFERVGAVRKNG